MTHAPTGAGAEFALLYKPLPFGNGNRKRSQVWHSLAKISDRFRPKAREHRPECHPVLGSAPLGQPRLPVRPIGTEDHSAKRCRRAPHDGEDNAQAINAPQTRPCKCWCKFGTCPCAPRRVHFSLRVSPASLRFRWHRGCQPQGGKSTHAPQTVRCRFVRIRPPDVPQLDEYFQIPCRAKDRRGFSACRPGRRARLSMMAAQT